MTEEVVGVASTTYKDIPLWASDVIVTDQKLHPIPWVRTDFSDHSVITIEDQSFTHTSDAHKTYLVSYDLKSRESTSSTFLIASALIILFVIIVYVWRQHYSH